jgi:hypothetical protein
MSSLASSGTALFDARTVTSASPSILAGLLLLLRLARR